MAKKPGATFSIARSHLEALAGDLAHEQEKNGTKEHAKTLAELYAAQTALQAHAELLEVLQDFDNWFAGFDPEKSQSRARGRQIVIRVRAAIAKATGAN